MTPREKQHALIFDAIKPVLAELGLSVIDEQSLCNRAAAAVVERLPQIEAEEMLQ